MTDNTLPANLLLFENLGVVQSKVPPEFFQGLTTAIDAITEENAVKYNHGLLGHMQAEYSLNHIKEYAADYILAMARSWCESQPGYIQNFEEASKSNSYSLYLDNIWVNKQKKHEFIPVHTHGGVLSFVIWIKIPYDLTAEKNYFPAMSLNETNNEQSWNTSKFTFYYIDILGAIRAATIPVDKSYEGTIVMFPSKLNHAVYPFYTSDEYRISVSGNIRIKVTS